MNYAPIMIPTLCRSEHFIRCIESLKKNKWACKTDVYIALDYPSKESHWKGYNEINKYLEGEFNEFSRFCVFKRTENYGPAKNSRELTNWILERYDCYIRTDDDIEFSPNFLEYMNTCLWKYKDDPNIIAVSGYSYPVSWKVSPGSTLLKINCVCPMWGTGFWKDKREKILREIETDYFRKNATEFIKNRSIYRLSNARLVSFAGALSLDEKGLMHVFSDVSIGAYLALSGKWIISPVISKCRNYGFDGSGVYCPVTVFEKRSEITAHNYEYPKQPIDESNTFKFVPDQLNEEKENISQYNQFDTRSQKEIKHAWLKIKIFHFVGSSNYFHLLKIKSKICSYIRR